MFANSFLFGEFSKVLINFEGLQRELRGPGVGAETYSGVNRTGSRT